MPTPIGITFMPSADALANGPHQARREGTGGSDLTEAFKILSLHLPRVLGASAIAPKKLLQSPGAAGVSGPGADNPYSAVFEALLQAMTGQSQIGPFSAQPFAGPSSSDTNDMPPFSALPAPHITPGVLDPGPLPSPSPYPDMQDPGPAPTYPDYPAPYEQEPYQAI